MMSDTYPKTLVVIRDCHAGRNLIVTAHTADDERLYRKMAGKKGWRVAVRKPKAEPTCDNCANMELLNHADGTAHRHCELFGQWIPDTEQSPVCDYHSALLKFEERVMSMARRGGAI
jgi:hypothetical protein